MGITPQTQPPQTLVFDKELVLVTHRPLWLVEQFFLETIALPYSTIIEAFERSTPSPQVATMRDVIERRIIKVRQYDIRFLNLCRCNAVFVAPRSPCAIQLVQPAPTTATPYEGGLAMAHVARHNCEGRRDAQTPSAYP